MKRRLSLLLSLCLVCSLLSPALASEEVPFKSVTALCVAAPGESVFLDEAEFQLLCRQATGHELESVAFSPLSRAVGELICDEEDPEESAYYLSRRPRLSQVRFTPYAYSSAARFTGQAELAFTMTSEKEESVPGVLLLCVEDPPAPTEELVTDDTVKASPGKAVDLCDHLSDTVWYQVKNSNTSEDVTSVTFTLPSSAQGSLWLDYGFETARKLLPEEVLFPDREPNFHNLTFVPAGKEETDVRLNYTISAESRGRLPASLTLRFTKSSPLVTPGPSAPPSADVSLYPPLLPSRFRDMAEWDWAVPAAEFLAGMGCFGSERSFRPGDNAKRIELIHALVLAAYPDREDAPAPDFSDLPGDPALAASVAAAAERGLVLGNGEGLLLPDQPITRQDALVILHRAMVDRGKLLPLYGDLSRFSDAGDVFPYAPEAVTILSAKGVLLGDDVGKLDPLSPITRAEMACLLYRAFA